MGESCFVIMPIGSQNINGIDYSEEELKNKYNDLIKKAVIDARIGIEVIRADEVAMPGSITNDILMKLMYSTYVVADISLPNPNVFYELGIRHAIRSRTILLKDKNINNYVFDISHSRFIEYDNTSTGLKELTNKFKQCFEIYDKNPGLPDNQFIELSSFVKFQYPKFIDLDEENRKKQMAMINVLTPVLQNPEMFKILLDQNIDQNTKNVKMFELMQNDPNFIAEMLKDLISSGLIKT
jgi:hypothetical protein